MKWFIPFLLSCAALIGQSIPYVQWKYSLNELLSINPMPATTETTATIAGKWYRTNSDGFMLWFDRESKEKADNTNIFLPFNQKGRWYRLSSATNNSGNSSVGLEMPTGFNVLNSPIEGTGEITVQFAVEGLVKAFDNEWAQAIPGGDYVAPGAITNSGLTVTEGQKLLGRSSFGQSMIEQIAVGNGLMLTNGLLSTGVYMDVQTYSDAGTYTWTNPPGALMTYVVAIGGGAGGYGGDTVETLDPSYTPNTNGPFMNFTYGDLPYYDVAGLYPVPEAAMPWSGTVTLTGFNTNLGVLQEVQVVLVSAMFGSFQHENTDLSDGAVIRSDMGLGSTLTTDTGSTILHVDFARSYTNTLPTYDGVTDFGGSSGVTVFFGLIGDNDGTNDYVLPDPMVARFSAGTNVNLTVGATNATVYFYDGTVSYVTQDNYKANSAVYAYYVYKPFVNVGNTVWYDVNTNGVVDVGEQGVVGATVTLTYTNGAPVDGFAPTLTDANGLYQFTGVHPGEYKVTVTGSAFDVPVWDPDTGATSPDGISLVTVGIDTNQFDMNFGFVNTAPASPKYIIGDLVWYDLNGTGTYEAGEPGIPNVEVWLETGGYIDFGPFPPEYVHGTKLATQYTDNAGLYYFKNVAPGDYEVWINTPPNTSFYADSTQTFAVAGVKFVTISTVSDYSLDFGYTPLAEDPKSGRGGGGGGLSEGAFVSALLPSTVTVTVGAGGTGGVGVTTNTTDHAGTTGGDSTFGTNIVAYGGGYEPWCMTVCTNGSGYGTVNGGQNGEPTYLYAGFLPRGGRTNGKGAGGGGAGGRVYEYGGNAFTPNSVAFPWLNGGAPDVSGEDGIDSLTATVPAGGGAGGGGAGVTRAGTGGLGGVPGGGGGGGGIGLSGVNGGVSGAGGNGGHGAVTVITFGIRQNP